ncbi:MAG: transcriptional repressor [Planctomycetota bacterium]|nr:transcriptional repressor [Planctomycetota bacterium]
MRDKDTAIDLLLKKHDLYRTAYRKALLQSLADKGVPLSARQIHECMGGRALPDLATVRGTLNTLARHGIVTSFSDGSGRKFVLSRLDRHEHLAICMNCGLSFSIEPSATEQTLCAEAQHAKREHGFRTVGHSVVHYGYCSGCSELDSPCICTEDQEGHK